MNVGQAISEVAKAIGPVYKDRSAQGYDYRGIEDFMNALSAPLANVGVVIVPHVDRVEHHDDPQGKKPGWVRVMLEVSYQIIGPEGDSITARVSADALDNSDKAHGKAMSYAYKTLVGQLFCVPTEDDNEQYDASDHDGGKPEKPKRNAKVEKALDKARAEFKALSKDDQASVSSAFTDWFDIPLKEIETLEQAEGLLQIIEDADSDEESETEEVGQLDELRELIDGLAKAELPEWAAFCKENKMKAGEPESWDEQQIEAAFDWLDGDN